MTEIVGPARATPPSTLPDALAARLRVDGSAPLVTFYDDASGERTELSGATFANWVAKTANLLVDGLGLGPGDRAAVTLPVHWQSLAVVAGCWAAGLEVVLAEADAGAGGADVAVAAEGGGVPTADEVLLLSLRPLGAGLSAPDGAGTDYAAEVRTYGDLFTGPGPRPHDPAAAGRSHADLCAGAGESGRVLLAPADDPLLDLGLLTAAYVAPLLGGGSVVLCRHADAAAIPGRAESERARR